MVLQASTGLRVLALMAACNCALCAAPSGACSSLKQARQWGGGHVPGASRGRQSNCHLRHDYASHDHASGLQRAYGNAYTCFASPQVLGLVVVVVGADEH